jgi:hypothetical protein
LSYLFVVILMTLTLIVLSVSGSLETRRRERVQRSVVEKTNAALEKYVKELVGQRMQLAKDNWSEAIRFFIVDHVRPVLSREELVFFHENFAAIALAVERAIEAVDQTAEASPAQSAPV